MEFYLKLYKIYEKFVHIVWYDTFFYDLKYKEIIV